MVSMTCPEGWHPIEKCWTVPERLADAGTTQSAPEPSQAATEARGDDERRRRYAGAIKSWELPERRLPVLLGGLIEKVMAVADAEQAELRAALIRVRALADAFADDGLSRYGGNIAWHIEEAIDNEKGDFPDAADQRIASQRSRAEAAESKVARAAEVLDPLIEGVEMDDSGEPTCHDYDRIDNGECALLADLRRVKAALDGDA